MRFTASQVRHATPSRICGYLTYAITLHDYTYMLLKDHG